MLLLTVIFANDEGFLVDTDPRDWQGQEFDFLLENSRIDQRASRNEQTCTRVNKPCWELAKHDILAALINERMAGVWCAATQANINVFLLGDEGRNFALTFGAVLAPNNNPETHIEPLRKSGMALSIAVYKSCSEPSFLSTRSALVRSDSICCSTGCESAASKMSRLVYLPLPLRWFQRCSAALSM